MADSPNSTTTSNSATDTTPKSSRRRSTRRPPSPRLTIAVDQELIDNAVRRDSRHCWIAEAIKAAVPEMTSITVDLQTIRFTDPKKRLRYSYLTPAPCNVALIDFDRGMRPEAFNFALRTAAQITRTGGRKGMKHGEGKTREQRRAEETERRAIKRRIYAKTDDLFEHPVEDRERVIRAMDDPTANLGPAMVFVPPEGDKTHIPVVVGGLPAPGNIARTRRFGLRQLRE